MFPFYLLPESHRRVAAPGLGLKARQAGCYRWILGFSSAETNRPEYCAGGCRLRGEGSSSSSDRGKGDGGGRSLSSGHVGAGDPQHRAGERRRRIGIQHPRLPGGKSLVYVVYSLLVVGRPFKKNTQTSICILILYSQYDYLNLSQLICTNTYCLIFILLCKVL